MNALLKTIALGTLFFGALTFAAPLPSTQVDAVRLKLYDMDDDGHLSLQERHHMEQRELTRLVQ